MTRHLNFIIWSPWMPEIFSKILHIQKRKVGKKLNRSKGEWPNTNTKISIISCYLFWSLYFSYNVTTHTVAVQKQINVETNFQPISMFNGKEGVFPFNWRLFFSYLYLASSWSSSSVAAATTDNFSLFRLLYQNENENTRACVYVYLCSNGLTIILFGLIMCVLLMLCFSTWLLVRSWTIDLQYIWSINPLRAKENLAWRYVRPKVLIHTHIGLLHTIVPIFWILDNIMQLKHRSFSTMLSSCNEYH